MKAIRPIRYALYVGLALLVCWTVLRASRSATPVEEPIAAPAAPTAEEPDVVEASPPSPAAGPAVTEVEVYSVGPVGPAGAHQLLLKAKGEAPAGKKYLPIFIGPFEGRAIQMALNGITPRRPMTHDLLNSVTSSCGLRLEKVTVTKLEKGTFYAEVTLTGSGKRAEIDARPSDSIALATRAGCPIYVADRVLIEAGRGEELLPSLPDEVFF